MWKSVSVNTFGHSAFTVSKIFKFPLHFFLDILYLTSVNGHKSARLWLHCNISSKAAT